MTEKLPLTHPERLKWLRNVNLIGTGVLVLAAPYVSPAVQAILYASAAINVAQAGGVEFWRQKKLSKNNIRQKKLGRQALQPRTS